MDRRLVVAHLECYNMVRILVVVTKRKLETVLGLISIFQDFSAEVTESQKLQLVISNSRLCRLL
jgi:hypothetical protein